MSDENKPGTDPEKFLETRAPSESPASKEPIKILVNSRADTLIGAEVMGYVLRAKIGQGGMGLVYSAEQPVIGKKVAIKVLRPEIAENPEQVKRLVAEARVVNAVGHRGIIDVFGYGELPDGRQCIVMEYLDGESLMDLLARNKEANEVLPITETMIILEEILSALGAAHGAGVVHRDLKPSNIFLCRQRDGSRYVKLLDFGIAKANVGSAAPSTNPSITVGTPSYMPPEQASGGLVSPAMDLYAMGIIAYEMLTNTLPFTGTSVVEVLIKHAEEKPKPPSSVLMSVPDDVDELVLKLLEKKPEDRYQTAESVRVDVVRVRKVLSESTARPSYQESAPVILPEPPKAEKNVLLSRSLMDQELGDVTAKSGFKPLGPDQSDDVTQPPTKAADLFPADSDETVVPRGRSRKSEKKSTRPDDVTFVPQRRAIPAPEPAKGRGLWLGLAGLLLGFIALGVAVFRPREPEVVVVEALPPPLVETVGADPLLAKLQAAEAKLAARSTPDPRLDSVRTFIKKLNDGTLDANSRKQAEQMVSDVDHVP